jgi:EAL domain-containing protein (putative c-di-GMP-specific phosphodiesterase class I)
MLGAIMRLFQDIGLGIRATGVATREQLCTLHHHGCDEIKGPLLAPALEALDIDRLTAIRQSFDAEAGLKSKTSLRLSVH